MTPSDPPPAGGQAGDELARAAEAEAAAAEARAEAARARADALRSRLDSPIDPPGDSSAPTPTRTPRPMLRQIVGALAALATLCLLAASGFMVWQHQKVADQRRLSAEFTAAARQDVINLMSMDYAKAEESVQRVLDGSTGKFRANFEETSEEFIKALQDEKIITKATVNDAAVDSMTDDSAVVLVSATSRREGPKAPKDQQQPRVWRVVLTLERADGQIKMSGVEFV
jgi:Mce-associated membrane protein